MNHVQLYYIKLDKPSFCVKFWFPQKISDYERINDGLSAHPSYHPEKG